jgi:hypothetical protein
VPSSVVVPADKLAGDSPLARAGVMPAAPETLVVDHGKIFISEHLTSACARLGISIQPAPTRPPTRHRWNGSSGPCGKDSPIDYDGRRAVITPDLLTDQHSRRIYYEGVAGPADRSRRPTTARTAPH